MPSALSHSLVIVIILFLPTELLLDLGLDLLDVLSNLGHVPNELVGVLEQPGQPLGELCLCHGSIIPLSRRLTRGVRHDTLPIMEVMSTDEILLKKYAANLAGSRNRTYYLHYAQLFLDNTRGLDRDSIDRYLDWLRARYSPGTVNFCWRVIRTLFNVNGIEWPYRRGEGPMVGQRDEFRPQLADEIISKMIYVARVGKLTPAEGAFVVLSSIYGLRREEMVNVDNDAVDLNNNVIFVGTIKSGRQRYHLIPPEAAPYLAAHDFSTEYALSTLSTMFHRVVAKAGYGDLKKRLAKKQRRIGWHSIRRAVLDGLVDNGVSVLAARAFLRWKSAADDIAMPARYFGNIVIDGKGRRPVVDEAKADEDIFLKHPFLPFWREDA